MITDKKSLEDYSFRDIRSAYSVWWLFERYNDKRTEFWCQMTLDHLWTGIEQYCSIKRK